MSEQKMNLVEHEVVIPTKEYKHGDAPVKPESSRADRHSSYELADFTHPTGREEQWRFTPIKRFATLLDETVYSADANGLNLQVNGQDLPLTGGKISQSELPTVSTYPAEKNNNKIGAPSDRLGVLGYVKAAHVIDISTEKAREYAKPLNLHLQGNDEQARAVRWEVNLAPQSMATIVLTHSGTGHLNESVQINVQDGATITLITTQEWMEQVSHAANHRIRIGAHAVIKHIVVSFGGDALRICSDLEFAGEGSECNLLGIYFTDSGQHQEHHVFVDHNATHCKSRVTYKGALQGEKAHSVWVGDVLIRKTATGTDSYEINRNIILTKGALADSVPNLEIETGEIEGAGHASATGRFDDEQLFYLMSRGISEVEARRLVVLGFFRELVNEIEIETVETHLMEIIENELEVSAK